MNPNKDCVFCKIVASEIPCDKVFENELFMVFLDIRPQAPGHSLVIPKKHIRWVWDVPHLSDYFFLAQKIAHAQRKAFETEMIVSHIIGDEVPHAHIWLVPQKSNKGKGWTNDKIVEEIQKNIE